MGQSHTLKKFDTEIDGLRSLVTTMGGLVERQFIRSVDAVRMSDLGIVTQVLSDERRVNQMHMESDLRCHQTIARQQPIAIDLREIIAIIHTNNDLERIGDESKKIAMKARDLQNVTPPIPLDRIERMASLVSDMIRAAIDAFVRHDVGVAVALGERDAEVDQLRDTLISDLISVMSERPTTVASALALIFVVQSIERVGDHAKNIAEYVINVVEGLDLRHASAEEIARVAGGKR